MANNKKKKITNDATLIDADFLQPIFGGDPKANPNTPEFNGHLHDGRNDVWGHAPKIDLTNHTTGRLTLQDNYVVAKSVSAYPAIIATPNNVVSGSFLNIPNSLLASTAALSIPAANPYNGPNADSVLIDNVSKPFSGVLGTVAGAAPNPSGGNINGVLAGNVNIGLNNAFTTTGISTPVYPFTVPNIITSAIWYFQVPLDMDTTKQAYFTFAWMGDILTSDGYGNVTLDPTKLTISGTPAAQTTTFRITWQWYTPGYAIFPPAVIYDGYTPANIPGSNINANTLTRGRIANLTVNDLPFRLIVNDSSNNNQNYVNLTGLQQATNAVTLGVQVDVLSSGYVTPTLGFQSGHLRFYQGTLVYLSKIMGSPVVSFRTL